MIRTVLQLKHSPTVITNTVTIITMKELTNAGERRLHDHALVLESFRLPGILKENKDQWNSNNHSKTKHEWPLAQQADKTFELFYTARACSFGIVISIE
jgi:hypothetical protein